MKYKRPRTLALYFLVCLCGASAVPVRAVQVEPSPQQSPRQQPSLTDSLKQAFQFAAKGQLGEAQKAYEQLLERARAEKNSEYEARAFYGMGYVASNGGQYQDARKYLGAALPFFQSRNDHARVGEINFYLGRAARRMGDSQAARLDFSAAVAAFQSAGNAASVVDSLVERSWVEISNEARVAVLQQAAEIARKLGSTRLQAEVQHAWADGLFVAGDYAAALEKLQQAIEFFEAAGARDQLPGAYTSMGRLLRAHGRAAEAIPFYEKALAASRSMGEKTGVVENLNAIAAAHGHMGNPAAARPYYEQALTAANETGSARLIDFARGGLAGNLNALGEYRRAAEMIEAILLRDADPNRSVRHRQLSQAYRGLGRLNEALAQAERALGATGPTHPNDLADALLERAMAHRALGQYQEALADASEVLHLLEQTRGKLIPIDFLKQGFGERHQATHSIAIDLYQRMGQPEKALEVSELARARAFLDLLATRDVQLKSKDAEQIAALRSTAGAQGFDEPSARPATTPVNLTLRGSATTAGTGPLAKSNPELASFVSAQPETVGGLVASAARLRTTVLSYWVAPDALFIWVITADGQVQSRRVDVSSTRLAELVRKGSSFDTESSPEPKTSNASVTRGDGAIALSSKSHAAWRELYTLLIQPVRSFLPWQPASRLTIVPHGPLLNVAFAALQNDKGRYLVEDYAIHLVPAGALLRSTASKAHAQNANRDYLIVADPKLSPARRGERDLPALPGAREEARAIQRFLPPRSTRLLVGAQASETDVTSAMANRAVVHLATHGIILDDEPLDSYLALSSGAGSGDGKLTAQDIYGLDLHADLVVLSACRSGSGRTTGDGIATLARAFFYAGTPSLIVSLWDVADEPSNRLLPEFYRAWLGGKDKALSLRAAQLRMLRELRSGKVAVRTEAGLLTLPEHPFFWAGFTLLGEP